MKRLELEKNILKILYYISPKEKLGFLKGKLHFFSFSELEDLYTFLKTGKYSIIYNLLDKKLNEYLKTIASIRNIKISKKLKSKVNKEKIERKKELENFNIDNLLN